AAFRMYFYQLQAVDWILTAKDSVASGYAARRLLDMPAGTASETTKYALMTLASGQKLSKYQTLYLKARRRMLANEDNFFSSIGMTITFLRFKKKQVNCQVLIYMITYVNLLIIRVNRGQLIISLVFLMVFLDKS